MARSRCRKEDDRLLNEVPILYTPDVDYYQLLGFLAAGRVVLARVGDLVYEVVLAWSTDLVKGRPWVYVRRWYAFQHTATNPAYLRQIRTRIIATCPLTWLEPITNGHGACELILAEEHDRWIPEERRLRRHLMGLLSAAY